MIRELYRAQGEITREIIDILKLTKLIATAPREAIEEIQETMESMNEEIEAIKEKTEARSLFTNLFRR